MPCLPLIPDALLVLEPMYFLFVAFRNLTALVHRERSASLHEGAAYLKTMTLSAQC